MKNSKKRLSKKRDAIIADVTAIRTRNNYLWMQLLKLALTENPKAAKKILKEISANDKAVTKCLSRV